MNELSSETKLTVNDGTKSISTTVAGKGNNEGQVASNANWKLTYTRAYNAYLEKLDAALAELGL